MTSADPPPLHDRDADVIARIVGDLRAGRAVGAARAVSMVENRRPGHDRLLAELHRDVGRARRVGVTGPPGAGKSTLTAALARSFRDSGQRVAIVAVDPTSPFTGGALLGDRIRMEAIALDPGVFIRSLATRGSLGGLSSATRDVCDVLDAAGFDVILLETVGVGQSELDVARAADTTLVVLVPESGDSIQTLKAGVMEIADVFCVNKADRPGAERLRRDIVLMLGLRPHSAGDRLPNDDAAGAASAGERWWAPPVLKSVASTGEGVIELRAAIDRHFDHLVRSGELDARRRARSRERIIELVEQSIRARLWDDAATNERLDAAVDGIARGAATPFDAADAIIAGAAGVIAPRADARDA